MAIKDVFKVSRKTFVNPTSWVGVEEISNNNKTIFTVLKALFTKEVPGEAESFEEAQSRWGLNDTDVEAMAHRYKQYAMFVVVAAILVFIYAFFLLFAYGALLGWLVSIGAAAAMFAQAFKFDFWSFQLRRKQLGLTFQDWKKSYLD